MNRHASEYVAVRIENKAETIMVAVMGVDLASTSWVIYGGRGLCTKAKGYSSAIGHLKIRKLCLMEPRLMQACS